MTVIGVLLFLIGAVGFFLMFTGIGGTLLPTLSQMPLGLGGWAILAAVGAALFMFFRRPAD